MSRNFSSQRGAPTDRGSNPPAGASAGQVQYPLPAELANLFRRANKSTLNPAVMFDRFVPDLSVAGEKEEWRKEALRIAAVKPDENALGHYLKRWREVVGASGATPFSLKTDWRFIPGLGRKSALEIGFNFHRYGFAYLPGSAVKGIARTYALYELAEAVGFSAEEPEALSKLDQLLEKPTEDFQKEIKGQAQWRELAGLSEKAAPFRTVFGTLEQAGGAIFFEALPTEAFELEPDIMNPHYGPYYQKKDEPPADWHNPIPVSFLTVPAGKEFSFAVGWRRGAAHPELRSTAEGWLKQGLRELGAGAKTAAGYGYFK